MADQFASTTRFTDRVADYVRFRPSYPDEVITCLQRELALPAHARIADIGSGTGIFSQLLLRHGYEVWGVEPNAAMQAAAQELLAKEPRFHSVTGTAEQTSLPDNSVDLVTAAQAFHWFDIPRTKQEFARILRRPKDVLLIWNDRKPEGSPFLEDYEDLLKRLGTDYVQLQHQHAQQLQAIPDFFTSGTYRKIVLINAQALNRAEFIGRALSSSYVPGPQHPDHQRVLQELNRIFDQHNIDGAVIFEYEVSMHLGQVA